MLKVLILLSIMSQSNTTPDFKWEKATSDNGKEYEIGSLTQGDETTPDPGVTPTSGFNVEVNWTVGDPKEWHYTSEDFKRLTGITRYKLYEDRYEGSFFGYILEFSNIINYHYYFTDKSPDWYSKNTFWNGDWALKYSSEKPTVGRVEGS
ncbi:hypothetical protein FRC09_003916 [Ceratobasidium sp. 395]|nr:hypothetical protein FRC09_003916 [Ceratobasidium sp. 395]